MIMRFDSDAIRPRWLSAALIAGALCAGLPTLAGAVREPAPASPVPAGAFDVCGLLTPAEIADVQKEAVIDAKASRPDRARFAVSQCFYTLEHFVNSISLEVTREGAGGSGRDALGAQWRRYFAVPDGGEEGGAPRPVAGLGDEAFWTAHGPIGALYVLKDAAYFRISIGGTDPEPLKIDKSKALAKKILDRLPAGA